MTALPIKDPAKFQTMLVGLDFSNLSGRISVDNIDLSDLVGGDVENNQKELPQEVKDTLYNYSKDLFDDELVPQTYSEKTQAMQTIHALNDQLSTEQLAELAKLPSDQLMEYATVLEKQNGTLTADQKLENTLDKYADVYAKSRDQDIIGGDFLPDGHEVAANCPDCSDRSEGAGIIKW